MSLRTFAATALTLCSMAMTSACASSEKTSDTDNRNINETKTEDTMKTDGKKLVVYFSHTGENYNVGYITEGNTAIVADMIADATGADRFEIAPEKSYPEDYNECIEVAKEEKQTGARPAIKGDVAVEDYDIIFLGYPNWWGEAPMAVYTFIESHDWNGKTVIPFITHEGSGMGGTDRKIAQACAGADVAVGKGLAIQGKIAQEQRDSTQRSVEEWLNGLNINK